MSLTPEQFKLLATKESVEKLDQRVDSLDVKIDAVVDTLDSIVTTLGEIKEGMISNTVAHDRINRDLWKVKNHEVEKMEVVQPLEA